MQRKVKTNAQIITLTILRRDCTFEVLGAAPAHARDEDDVVEEEEAPVLPAPGAGAGGDHVEPDQGPGRRH